jgi:hypothetical protein
LQKYGYEILPSEWQKLYLEIEKKLCQNAWQSFFFVL